MTTKENAMILLATQMKIDASVLQDISHMEIEIRVVPEGGQLLTLLGQKQDEIVMVLLDTDMPDMPGMEVLAIMKERGFTDDIPVIMVSSRGSADWSDKASELGAFSCFSYPTEKENMKSSIANMLRFFWRQKNTMHVIREQNEKLTEEKNRIQNQDELTGCLSFSGFKETARRLIIENPEIPYEIWYCDVKQFKLINNAFGYENGDYMLKWWFCSVAECLDDKEAIGRMSGDKMLVLAYTKEGEELGDQFNKVNAEIDHILSSQGSSYEVDMASGVYLTKPQERLAPDVNHMVDMANVAQRSIKKQKGRNFVVYSEDLWEQKQRAARINQELKGAMERGEISIWLQPQYNYATGEMVGAEALCRWIHPELGFISPGEFIPALEEAGQIPLLDKFVWEEACRYIRKWMEENPDITIALSVNVSRMDIQEPGFLQYMENLLEKYQMSPKMLCLEITESAYIDEPEQLIAVVKKLQGMGFTVEMDDFGSGYSSLNMLKEVPVDVLKLDMKFLSKSGSRSKGGNILSSVIRLSHSLELPVIAEGVETMEQANFLKNMGCNLMQGYWFAKPLPVPEFEKLLKAEMLGEMPRSFKGSGISKLDEVMDSESNSSFIFDSCIGGAMLLECAGKFVDAVMVNDAFYETAGITRKAFEQCRRDILSHMEEKDGKRFLETLATAIKEGIAICEGFRLKNGRILTARYRCVSSGERSSVVFALIEDVTKNYELQEKLNKITEDYYSHMELMPGGFFRYGADGEQKFTFISKSMLDMLGYTREEFMEKFNGSFQEMVYEEDRQRVMRELDLEIKNGVDTCCEYRIEKADGTLKWVYDVGRLIVDEDGQRWYYVVITDIDEHKEILQEQLWSKE